MTILGFSVFYLVDWAIRLLMLIVVPRRTKPTTAMAWLLVIFAVPWLGLPLYLAIGENALPRYRIRRYQRAVERLQDLRKRSRQVAAGLAPQLEPGVSSAARLVERLGYLPVLGGGATRSRRKQRISSSSCLRTSTVPKTPFTCSSTSTAMTPSADALPRR